MTHDLRLARCLRLGVLLAAALLSACSTPRPSEQFEPTMPEELPPAAGNNGAIYQVNHDVALFENPVARRVGDIVTIRLVEKTAASKNSSTSTKKSSNKELDVPNLFGRTITHNGNNVLSAEVNSDQDFSGEGSSEQSNSLDGDITVTVAKRYANGNLLVRGQKWIMINQGREYVRIEGLVRAIDVQPDNTIESTKVANATISYSGQGALADANAQGWLMRFFNSPMMPF